MSPLLPFVSVTFFLVITPGATTALVVHHALRFGFRGGAVAAVAGMGAAMAATRWPQAMTTIRVAGALYLAWLGANAIRRASGRGGPAFIHPDAAETAHEPVAAMRQGWLVNVLNPSILAFYVTVVPSFLRVGEESNPFALLAAIHVTMAFACHLLWAAGFSALRASAYGPRIIAGLDVAAGIALIVLGIGMLRQ